MTAISSEATTTEDRRCLLRFITCGSVDDGKSTLLGRMLYDAKMIPDDQLVALVRDSKRQHPGDEGLLDFALLTDGLDAEREQGITIDVAYRYFRTARRSFIVADCPGHEQYTRNMATGASHSDLAVVLVDVTKGLLPQTRRHTYICSLLGIRHLILAVNKMDIIGYSQSAYESIVAEYSVLAKQMGIVNVSTLPVSAVYGDNVGQYSENMPWYVGATLIDMLEQTEAPVFEATDFRLPVQWVNRPDQFFRGYTGTVAGGSIAKDDEIIVQPGGQRSRIDRIVTADGDIVEATDGQAITVVLDRDVDVSRGDVISAARSPLQVADQFACHLIWMGDEAMLPNRTYWLQIGTRTVNARITAIKHKVDVNSQAKLAAVRLELNEVGYCNIDVDHVIPFETYERNRTLGGFILVDRQSNATVACGMLDFALRRAANVHWQHVDVDKQTRAITKGQHPLCVWFTGLSGSGKSTIANLVERRLHAVGYHTYLLDGDNIRHGLNKDLGFTAEARVENIRRMAEIAHLMVDAGLVVLVCAISPFEQDRRFARERFDVDEFVEVFVDAPLTECERRDPKGLYLKARNGKIKNFTGIDSPYEIPKAPEEHLITVGSSAERLAEILADRLLERIKQGGEEKQ